MGVSWRVFTTECCSQQSQKMAPFTERLLLVLKGSSSDQASHRSTGPWGFWRDPVRGHWWKALMPCGQDRIDGPVSTVLLLRLWQSTLQIFSPKCSLSSCSFCGVMWKIIFYTGKTEEPIPSQHSQSINIGVSSVYQHLTLNIISTSDFTVTHIWVWHFSSSLYLFVNNIKHIQWKLIKKKYI